MCGEAKAQGWTVVGSGVRARAPASYRRVSRAERETELPKSAQIPEGLVKV